MILDKASISMMPGNVVKLRQHGVVLFVAFWALFGGVIAKGASNPPERPYEEAASDYSDVECLTAVISIEGKGANSMELLAALHPASGRSNSLSDLSQVATAKGFKCRLFQHLSTWQLQNCRQPLILHVMASPFSRQPDHFLVYLGSKGNCAVLRDEQSVDRLIQFSELWSRWSGEALIVASSSAALDSAIPSVLRQPAWTIMIVLAAGVTLLPFALAAWPTHKVVHSGSAVRVLVDYARFFVGIVAFCGGLGMLSSRLSFGGGISFLSSAQIRALKEADLNSRARRAVTPDTPLREIDTATAVSLQRSGVLFVDARDPGEFQAGHIPSAINVPAASDKQIRFRVHLISKDRPIVVYCGVSTCAKAQYVAEQLRDLEFTTVSVYPGGWAAWPYKDNK